MTSVRTLSSIVLWFIDIRSSTHINKSYLISESTKHQGLLSE